VHSPLAYIHPDAKIGANVTIEPFAVVHENTVLGDDCYIYSHAVIHSGARLGKGVRIFNGAVVSGIPQDLKFSGEDSTAELGDYTTVRECATINRGTKAYGKTVVGKHSLIMAYAHVAHDCILGDHVILVNSVALAGHVEIGEFAILGGLSAVHQFVHIGAHAMIGGGALVRKDVPPFIKVAKEPLSFEGVNAIGLERRGFTPDQIDRIHHAYRLLYQSGLNTTQAVDRIAEEAQGPEIEAILSFVQAAERGIVKGR
jgi:UDP-N-acetylglucosamine acyltransferase